jgi:hypothetical protein
MPQERNAGWRLPVQCLYVSTVLLLLSIARHLQQACRLGIGRHLSLLAHPNSKSRESEGLDTLWYQWL